MIDFNRKLIRNFDFSVLLIVLLLISIGMMIIASATYFNTMEEYSKSFLKVQLTATVLGLLIIAVIQFVDYRWLKEYSSIIYLFTLAILTVTLVFASTVSGSKSWFRLGPVSFQPSEIAKLAMIIVLAAFISSRENEMKYLSGMLKTCGVAALPVLLVLAQNDLGTSLVFIGITIGMLYVGGGNAKLMTFVIVTAIVLVLVLVLLSIYYDFSFPFLKAYQLKRLQVLIDPYIDPYGHGYNIIQSKIAIGSGQLFGKGLFNGTQNQLRFLPEQHTDFIFPVIGEELGFVGATFVLILYFTLLIRCVFISRDARDSFGTLVVVGVASMWMFHILENVGMTMGVMPVTGIPLPFVSYGGSSLLTNLIAVGLVLNVRMRKQKIMF
ncbi:MAG: rod shape-determining protein RodA [Halanaerobiales bacterium]|nr:rod shape-determining protein RodA [Halanaerobiales bacterium]